jgi:cell wall-associated protease
VVWASQKYLNYEGSCTLQEKSCFSIFLLGNKDPRLETLRRFRDEVLSKTSSGKKLIRLYYGYSDIIVEILAANPALKNHAKELLEQVIPQIEALVQGKSADLFISDSLQQSADAVISALDAGLATPLQEQVAPLQKDMEAAGVIKR